MKQGNLHILFFILLISVPIIVSGQREAEKIDSSLFNLPIVDDISTRLPTVEALIDSAIANSPYLRLRDDEIKIDRLNLKNVKADLLNSFAGQASMSYGYSDVYSESQSSSSVGTSASLSLAESWRYSAGASVKISLYDLTQRKNNIRIAKTAIEQSINTRNVFLHELRMEVLVQYNNLLLQQKLLKIWNDNYQTAQMQVQMAEIQFINGNSTLDDMARMTDRMVRAQAQFEQQKTDFLNAYRGLEHLTGMKFNIINELKY